MYYRTAITSHDLNRLLPKSPLIIDIRDPFEFARYHFPTAVNVPYRTLVMYPEKYLKKQYTYYIICANGSKSLRASQMLNNMGYQTVNIANGYLN